MNTVTGTRTIPAFLEFHASSRPDATAVMAETSAEVLQSLTWSALHSLVQQASNWIYSQGLRKGDGIVLHIPNSLELYLLWLAAASTGTVAVPVDPRCTAPELRHIVIHSDARLLVTHEAGQDIAHTACAGAGEIVRVVSASPARPFSDSVLGEEIASQPCSTIPHEPHPLDVVAMLYTSGTTGKPKGVMLTHAAYLYGAEVFARSTALTQQDRHLIALPMHHAAAQCHAITPSLVTGASIAIMERFSASRFMEQATRHRATRAALFAAPLRMLLRQHAGVAVPESPLRLVTFAQNLTHEELSEWESRFRVPLLQLWGMTETIGLPLMVPLHGPQNNMCMGLPVAGYEVKLVDESGNPVPPGTAGELIVRANPGWTVTSGYYKNPAATAGLIRDSWLWTGDRALQDANGEFHFVGRSREMIKRGGENISPLEVEEALKAHPGVQDAAVVGVPDPLRDESLVAFVILRPANETTTESLQEWCRQKLSAFKVPGEFQFCAEFPRTSVGKTQRHLLRESYLASKMNA